VTNTGSPPAPNPAGAFGIATFRNSYAALPGSFYARTAPTAVAAPRLIAFNHALARELGLDTTTCDDTALAAIFSGNVIPSGADPLAIAYAGHQFGNFVPQLGDGRAILIGEVIDHSGRSRDIQLKGSGPTPFSRRGDGRAALGPVLREYLVSEAMHALGIPSTRALAAVTTGDMILREGPVPGAVLTRVAASHVRVGTFEYFAARDDQASLKQLTDYVITRHYADAGHDQNPALALLKAVVGRQAQLIAKWMGVGFIHGVMNTDNMAISGETIDFGPCAFMESYDSMQVFSAIDEFGRYAYANQPRIAQWNLARFAEALLPLIDDDQQKAVALATEAISGFSSQYETSWLEQMRHKLGLMTVQPDDEQLIRGLLDLMQAGQTDFTSTFRTLSHAANHVTAENFTALFPDTSAIHEWLNAWRLRLSQEIASPAEREKAMLAVNPVYIPRNHRIEAVIRAAVDADDFTPFDKLRSVLARPFTDTAAFDAYKSPAQTHERVLRTFCGT
jgi:uncharacterized protein YdiU (UPF0061 family)